MGIYQTVTTSFKAECLQGIHNLLTDTLNIALYTSNATLDFTTTVYVTDNEITSSGYIAGGITLTNVTVNSSDTTAYVSFDNPTWNGSIVARGALIYNASKGNRAIAVIDFGNDKSSSNNFTLVLPSNTATTALIRLAN